MNRIAKLFLIIWTGIFALAGFVVSAHENETEIPLSYYVAGDEKGVHQVYQLLLGDATSARQITHSEWDVLTFGVAYDGLSIAYVTSHAELWLQPIHTEEAELLTTLTSYQFYKSPVYSQDGSYIAYADDGVWLYDLANRQTRQLIANIPLANNGSNMEEYRLYAPEVFVSDADGNITHLIVDVGIWEWNTVGVYDFIVGDLQVLGGQFHTDMLYLGEDVVLLYGNNAISGATTLDIASLENINSYRTSADMAQVTTDATLFAEQAIKLESGLVRIFGTALIVGSSDNYMFYMDANLQTGAMSRPETILLPKSTTGSTVRGTPSPDGHIMPVYVDALWRDYGTIFGALQLVDLSTHETIAYDFPEITGVFNWQH